MASHVNYSLGDRIWIPHDEDAWLAGRIEKSSSSMIDIMTERGLISIVPSSDPSFRYEPCGSHIDDNVENLVDLDELSEGAILHHIRKRFKKKLIYTYVGSILVAVNPFEKLPIYSKEEMSRATAAMFPYPHVYVTAANAFKQLQTNRKNQSVLISGESGAGKTETTKKVLSYLANVTSSNSNDSNEPGLEEKILQSNPLLEALGNAKTLRNDNSSRFGKWMKISFSSSFSINRCEIINYLLEKSRIVTQNDKERNYHIFYQILASENPDMESRYLMRHPSDYYYLNQTTCFEIDNVNDKDEYETVINAMNILDLKDDSLMEIFDVIMTVLNLGNIRFTTSSNGEDSLIDKSSNLILSLCSNLLGVDASILTLALTQTVKQMGRSSLVAIQLTVPQATETRDGLAKLLYSYLFDYIIKYINKTLSLSNKSNQMKSNDLSIGILDIFGFEVFDVNSFEQLCINYANEKLQLHFNEVIFHEETKMYVEEGVSLSEIVFEDNAECVSLIESKPLGIISLLDEECTLGKATDVTFISKLDKCFGLNKPTSNKYFIKHRTKQMIFSVKHFAGQVEYNVTNFLDKNRDTTSQSIIDMIKTSKSSLIQEIFIDLEGKPNDSSSNKNSSTKASPKITLGGQFRMQLISLLSTLKLTEPHFIRCVKPNHLKLPSTIDSKLTLRQLRYAGLFEAIRIRKSGYAYRCTHDVFACTYDLLVDRLRLARISGEVDSKEVCEIVLKEMTKEKVLQPNNYFVGRTKVFLKDNVHRTFLERRKATRITVYVIAIQSLVRGALVREKYKVIREQWIQERNRILRIIQLQYTNAIIIQKYTRRYLVQQSFLILKDIILLRRYIKSKDIQSLKNILKKLENEYSRINNNNNKDKSFDYLTIKLFNHEISLAKIFIKLIDIQTKFLNDLTIAIDKKDVKQLNILISQAKKLDLIENPLVKEGKQLIDKLYNKKIVIDYMIKFLTNENDVKIDNKVIDNLVDSKTNNLESEIENLISKDLKSDTLTDSIDPSLKTLHNIKYVIAKAKEYGIDSDFISKVERLYISIGPRIQIRNNIRQAIELVDESGIIEALREIETIQVNLRDFCDIEAKAGKAMLKMFEFDRLIYELNGSQLNEPRDPYISPNKTLDKSNNSESDNNLDNKISHVTSNNYLSTGPRLTKDLISQCDKLCNPSLNLTSEQKSIIRNKLRLVGQSAIGYEMIIRSYKWSKIFCVWKYPELNQQELDKLNHSNSFNSDDNNSDNDEVFFGLNLTEARSSTYIIKLLHKELQGVNEIPASIQAGLGSLDLPYSVINTLEQFEAIDRTRKNSKIGSTSSYKQHSPNNTIKRNDSKADRTSFGSPSIDNIKNNIFLKSQSKTVAPSTSPFSSLESQLLQSRLNYEKQKKVLEETKAKYYKPIIKANNLKVWK